MTFCQIVCLQLQDITGAAEVLHVGNVPAIPGIPGKVIYMFDCECVPKYFLLMDRYFVFLMAFAKVSKKVDYSVNKCHSKCTLSGTARMLAFLRKLNAFGFQK